MRQFAENRFEQRGLARAVSTDDGGQLPAVGVQIHVPQQPLLPDGHADVFNF
jgi:hypothetical protein